MKEKNTKKINKFDYESHFIDEIKKKICIADKNMYCDKARCVLNLNKKFWIFSTKI